MQALLGVIQNWQKGPSLICSISLEAKENIIHVLLECYSRYQM